MLPIVPFRTLITAFLVSASTTMSLSAQQADLLKLVPTNANAILVIDADALKKTPLATERGWFKKVLNEKPSQEIAIPPTANKIIVSSELETSGTLHPAWSLSLVSSSAGIPIHAIAEAEQGYVDWLGSSQIVWSPKDAYFVAVDLKTLGIYYPADRQMVSKWLDWTKSQTAASISDYLKFASDSANGKSQIVMAIDLQDVPQPHRITQILGTLPMLKENNQLSQKWQDLLMGIRGLTVKLTVNKDITGELTVDFEDDPSVLAPYEKQLVMSALSRYGATIADLDQWTFRTNAASIVATGSLSTDSFRRLMTLMEIPSTQYDDTYSQQAGAPQANAPAPTQPSADDIKLKATKTYYDSLTTLINDLHKERDVTTYNYMLWYEKYAKKIDNLPMLNVDNDLLNFGQAVADTFRDIALAKRTGGITANVRRTETTANTSNDDFIPANTLSAINAEEGASGYKKMYSSWNQIESDLAKLKRQLTDRYQIEF